MLCFEYKLAWLISQKIVWDTNFAALTFSSCKGAALISCSSKKMFLLSLIISYVDKWQAGGLCRAKICLRLATGWKRLWAGIGHPERLKEEAHTALRIGFAVSCTCIEVNKITRNQKWDANQLPRRVSVNLGFPLLPSLAKCWDHNTVPPITSPAIRQLWEAVCVHCQVMWKSCLWRYSCKAKIGRSCRFTRVLAVGWEPGSSSSCREIFVKTG